MASDRRTGDHSPTAASSLPPGAGGDRAARGDARAPRRRAHAGLDRRRSRPARASPATWPTWLRRGRPRGRQHLGDDPGGDRRHDARRAGRRRPPVHRAADRAAPRRGPPAAGRRHDGARPRRLRRRRRCASPAAARVRVLGRMPRSVRLWVATLDLPVPLLEHLDRCGRPIRYRYVPGLVADRRPTPTPSPASRGRPRCRRPGRVLTPEVVTDLVAHGIVVAPIVLHTGVASLEAHETPYPERYRVPAATARLVNADPRQPAAASSPSARPSCGRWRRSPTTTGRAPGRGLDRARRHARARVRVVDGLLTGWHEPEASHLQMLEAVAGRPGAGTCLRARRSTPGIAGTSSATST